MQWKCQYLLAVLCFSTLLASGIIRAEQTSSVPDAAAQPTMELSVAKAVELAVSQSPVTREAISRTAAADARLRFAKALLNPTLSVAHWAGRDTGGLDEDIILSEIFELGGKRKARISQASSEREAAYSDESGTMTDTTFSTKSAYYEALRADNDYQLAKNTLDIIQQFTEAARTQYTAGDIPRSNVLRAELEQTRAEQDLTTAATDRSNRYATLRSLIGIPENDSIQLTDKLTFSSVAYKLPDLQTLALTNRPDVRAAKSLVESSRAAVELAKAQSRPDAFVEGRRASIIPSVEGASIRGGIVMPLLDLGRNRAEVAAAKAALAEQQSKLDETVRTAKLEVETALNTLNQAQKVVESFESGRLDRVKELLNMTQIGYSRGASSYLEVLDAQRVYRSEESDYIRALASYNTALASLERAVGGRLR